MKLLKLWRTFKEGVKNYIRNGWLSFATVSIMAVSVFIMSLTILLVIGSRLAIKNIEEDINVSVYFNPDVSENRILEIRKILAGYKEIEKVEYISKNQALDELLSDSKDNPFVRQALNEIGENPLLSSLAIKARDPSQYEIIVQSISQSYFENEISWINYDRNKTDIEQLRNLTGTMEKTGFILGAIFLIVAVLITFNTIRITIYTHRQELEIMRLVGASNMYIRLPHIFEGLLYGLTSAVTVIVFLYLSFQFVAPVILQKVVDRKILMSFFFEYFVVILFFVFAASVFLGTVSSLIAIRRYLKI